MQEINKIILMFFIYSFIGWTWETIYCSLNQGHLVKRGFLMGPITPIYGFGVLGMLYIGRPFSSNIIYFFIISTMLVTVLEYYTAYLLDKYFKLKLWDYSDLFMNIKGRIALQVSIFWGIGCLIINYIVQPKVLEFIDYLTSVFGIYLGIFLVLITTYDFIWTVVHLKSFEKLVIEVEEKVLKAREHLEIQYKNGKLNVETKVNDRIEKNKIKKLEKLPTDKEKLKYFGRGITYTAPNGVIHNIEFPKFNWTHRRLIGKFSDMEFKSIKVLKKVKEELEKIYEEIEK